ncbi:MAG TPA: HAMP domain-containing sensor histidine kinase [Candidatus Saccharimonadales bacterium]|nr:HAMP domain-containing sensor histidine kinase [Candidatus Saccharimonadales bacterium]
MKGERVDLVVAVAHELKAPLALIRHLSYDLKETDLSQNQKQAIERIIITAERSLRLASQLTNSSRLENIRNLDLINTLEPTNVQLVCEQALNEMLPFAAKFDQKLHLIKRRSSNLALANREVLHDVIVNLLDNSVRHNPQGGLVELSIAETNGLVRLNVKDNGPGIDAVEFKSVSNTIGERPQPFSARPGTSGLGLYVAGRLTAAMGGRLSLGKARQGASFFVDLLQSNQMSFIYE